MNRCRRLWKSAKVLADSLSAVIDAFLDWTKMQRAADTFEWYRSRRQRLVDR